MISLALAGAALADNTVFSVSGKVMSATSDNIKVRTATRNIDFSRDKATKIVGDMTKDSVVTVKYDKVAGLPHALEVTVTSKYSTKY